MENRLKITVGLCVKNGESNINETLESIFNQIFPRKQIELIIVYGGSRDKTLTKIKENLSNVKIRSKIFCENEGIGAARQIVVKNADGDYIVWIDCGLIIPKNYLRKQVEFMDRNPKVGIAKGMYGILQKAETVSILENIAFAAAFSKCNGKPAPRLPGTEGSIYRVEAIRQVGGFDRNIRGAGEDLDAAYRIGAAGWTIYVTDAIFYEKYMKTWKELWDHYFRYGYGGHFLFHKNKQINPVYEMLPITGFLVGIVLSLTAYRLTHEKVVFLLPMHYLYKRIAWLLGFLKSHVDGYGHNWK